MFTLSKSNMEFDIVAFEFYTIFYFIASLEAFILYYVDSILSQSKVQLLQYILERSTDSQLILSNINL